MARAAILLVALAALVSAYEAVDVTRIDPYSAAEGDFLTVNLHRLERQALEAYAFGAYEEAARYYLAALRYDVTDVLNIYNLACCYGLLEEPELAARYLALAVEAGFTSIEQIQRDGDFDPVRGAPAFAAVIDTIAQSIERQRNAQGERLYLETETILPCYLQTPPGLESDVEYPLVVALHGYGSTPENFALLWDRLEDPGFFLACPRAPFELEGTGFRGYSWTVRWLDQDYLERSSAMTEEYVLGLVEELRSRYPVSHVYLMGHSQGAGFTYEIALGNPELFDGLIASAGRLYRDWIPDEELEAASHLPVMIIHGHRDRAIEYRYALEAKRLLEGFGYEVTLFDFEGGHRVPAAGMQAMQRWIEGRG